MGNRQMRWLGFALVAGLLVGMPVPMAIAAAPSDGLLLHYDFESTQTGDGTVADVSGNGFDGAVTNANSAEVVLGHDGSGQALSLSGGAPDSSTAPYITVPAGLFEGLNAITVSAWTQWDGGDDFQWLYDLGKDNTAGVFLSPSFAGEENNRTAIKPVNGTQETGVSGLGKLAVGEWVNVTTTVDGQTISYYVDGVKVGSAAAVVDLDAAMYDPAGVLSGFIGKPFWGGHPFYAGDVDDFRVYDRALSEAEVIELVGIDALASHLVLSYDFEQDQVDGSTVDDLSSRGLDGTIENVAQAEFVEGHDGGRALSLRGGAWYDSSTPYVSIPNGLFDGMTQTTVSTWAKWDGGGTFQPLYQLGPAEGRTLSFVPAWTDGDKARAWVVPTTSGPVEASVSAAQTLQQDTWVNLTTTLDGQTMSFYINGILVGTSAAPVDLSRLVDSAADGSGFIGKSYTSWFPYYAGDIDDFRVWDVAFSEAHVRTLMGDELPAFDSLEQTEFSAETISGLAPVLPTTVRAFFSDSVERSLPIVWDDIDPASYASVGSFDVQGVTKVSGTPVVAHVTVTASQLDVDLAQQTGEFLGGASGTLYGVYGDGVPSNNLIDGINLRTVSTKAQDGPQHPGADAIEVAKQVTDSSGGLTFIYMTDIWRGFPYEVPGDTGDEKLQAHLDAIRTQVEQVATLEQKYQDHIVFVPFNEPENNMFSSSANPESFYGQDWLSDPTQFHRAWNEAYALITSILPDAKIAGPNAGAYYPQFEAFLENAVANDTVPQWMTWHELDGPGTIRTNVDRYRTMEAAVFAGTAYEGTVLPINLNEYANNYHVSVPGEIIQWVAAIEDKKVDADLAYWNIDGNLSDTTVEGNRGNGQWWLLNKYSEMTGQTVVVTPPNPNVSYTLQGVATLDTDKKQANLIFGGQSGQTAVSFDGVDTGVFGDQVHAIVTQIPWTGQLGDSAQPLVIGDRVLPVIDGRVSMEFGLDGLPQLDKEAAYQVVLSPGVGAVADTPDTLAWSGSYEAEDAQHSGSTYSVQGPEGGPTNTYGTYTSGDYEVNGFRTGGDVTLDFPVSVPVDGRYDLSVFANSLNKLDAVAEQGPTNVFLRVDGGQEQQLFLSLGHKYIVWGTTHAAVDLTAGDHVITLSTSNLAGDLHTQGEAVVDRLDLSVQSPTASETIYQAENAILDGASTVYDVGQASGSGAATLASGDELTFWVYAPTEGERALSIDVLSGGTGTVTLNGQTIVGSLSQSTTAPAYFSGGINKVVVAGVGGELVVDRLRTAEGSGVLSTTRYEAEDATVSGTATVTELSLASGGAAVTGIGGDHANTNTLSFDSVAVDAAGTYALTIRYSNEEQSPASHYNPDPLARHAELSINGAAPQRVWFAHSFHENNFWELTVPVELSAGVNTLSFSSEELPNFDGVTYASDVYPSLLLRSSYAANIDWIAVTPYTEPTRDLQITATATTRCVRSKVVVAVTVANSDTAAVAVDVESIFGSKSFESVAPQRSAFHPFSTRRASIDAGSVMVSAQATIDGQPRTGTVTADYSARTCG